ncbi:ubiquitin carboxyl-terminal hydrolase 40 isoform X8 [Myotis myotis]|uniref:ubiquitin carboxyl-terminal hydrolase 40 isoform X8 n=1 Tax=Myotis myotis TaxID=51298 RepID=UPI001748F55C|nr:ubiquitin carboxyl-terminal hydrolase 40 isoform X8 [Myotis myotis]
MFGDLFEEDYSSVSTTNQYGKGKELKAKPLEPPAPREFTNLSGIRNQGGTCYLNSLLQTLHFTPEFREALFSLGPEELGSLEEKDNPDAKVRIIPLQLQRLFAQLLLLDQEAASTADLTDSFGWTSNEEMRQHDVQELNRILFSALETSLVGTSGHDLINRLYHGTIVNQIVCKECKNVSEKQEDFLDLTVAVKNVTGLEDALWNMYVEEEVFDCDNLYHCGSCDRLVKAAKSAKLRKLPPFLTVSLLRFNFDFVKCERYKETSCYTFPLRINLKPFCEQSQLDDLEYMYDLFSVIIHKGGCYGGHYHVYIKDVDHLGNWQLQEEKSKPDVNLKDLQNEEEIDDPLMILKTILSQEESNLILVDLLGQKFLKKIGISWNKKYRKQYGPLRKFLQLHSQIFLLSSDQSKVSLLKNSSLQAESDLQRKDQQIFKTLTSESPGLNDRTSCSHWFDINDSKVQPIEEKDIKQQFQGKESAYMLFYRKSQLQRPPEARANPRYRVPCHLLNEMDAANIELQTKRTEYDSTNNIFELHLHLGPHYHFFNGALHPVVSQTESVWDLTFDKRKTLGDLRQSIFQLLEFWEGDMVLSVAKFVPAGLHIYQTLDGDDLTLCDIEIADEEDIFVWNGVEVGGIQIPTGIDCEPLLLNVLHPATGSEECRQLVESPLVFPANAEVGTVFTALAIPGGVIFTSNTASVGGESWTAIPKEDLKKTFREQGLRNGSSILIQDSSNDNNSLLTKQGKWITTVNEVDWVQVNNLCQLESEEEQVKISATVNACLKIMLEKFGLPGDTWHLRKMDWCYEAGEPLCEEGNRGIGFTNKSPVVCLFLAEVTSNKKEFPYSQDATLKELMLCSGDTLLLTEGKLPSPGLLNVPIWWYQPPGPKSQGKRHLDQTNCTPSQGGVWRATSTPGAAGDVHADVPLRYLGDVKISEDATLGELKAQAMTLPSLSEFFIPSPAFLRAWTVDSKRPGRLLRKNQQQLREYKLGRRTEICLEPLQKEEHLGPQDMLLRTQMRLPGERAYALPMDMVWDAARGTASSLRQRVADFYSLPVEKIEIAKYFPDKFEWLPVSSWNQQITKRKKKKKQDNLQGAPYYLKDGDIIGIKNLLVEEDDDFSTVRDDIGREDPALGKRKSLEALRVQSNSLLSSAETPGRPHRPEASLSIHVGSFR